jgi:hypothetical protein
MHYYKKQVYLTRLSNKKRQIWIGVKKPSHQSKHVDWDMLVVNNGLFTNRLIDYLIGHFD